MPETEGRLDELLRRALSSPDAWSGAGPGIDGSGGSRGSQALSRVVSGVHRRRLRNLRGLGLAAVVVIALAVALPLSLGGGSGHPVTSATGLNGAGTARAQAGGRVAQPGGQSQRAESGGTGHGTGTWSPAESAHGATIVVKGGGPERPRPTDETLRVGQTLFVTLTPISGRSWGRPEVVSSSRAVVGSARVVELAAVRPDTGRSGRTERFEVVALHPGTSVVQVAANPIPAQGSAAPSAGPMAWTLTVTVSGS